MRVGILHDDGRSLAAEFEADLGDVLRGGGHDALACTHGTRNADDINLWRASHLVANDGTLARDDIDDTCGQASLCNHFCKLRTVLGRELTRLDDDGTTGNQGGTSLAGNEEEREVPGQDACHDADGLLREQDGLVGSVGGDNLAFDVTGEGGHVLEISDGSAHLDRCPGAGLALLAHDNLGEFLLAFLDTLGHPQQVLGTFDGRRLAPGFLGGAGGIECAVHIFNSSFRLT